MECTDELLDLISAVRNYIQGIADECEFINSKTASFLEEKPTRIESIVLHVAITSLNLKIDLWFSFLEEIRLAETLPTGMNSLRENVERLKKNEADLKAVVNDESG